MTAQRYVIIALALSAALFIIAGDRWNERVAYFKPVAPAPKVPR